MNFGPIDPKPGDGYWRSFVFEKNIVTSNATQPMPSRDLSFESLQQAMADLMAKGLLSVEPLLQPPTVARLTKRQADEPLVTADTAAFLAEWFAKEVA